MSTAQQLTLLERLEIVGARAIGALPPAAKRALAGAPIRLDGLELDLDMQVVVKLAERNPRTGLVSRTAAEAREDLARSVRAVAGAPAPMASVQEITVAGAQGALGARLFVPSAAADARPRPLIVFYHGGGWVAGDLDTHDHPCRMLAESAGMRVLSVDYRRAPEHPFPAPVDDALTAFRDVVARAGELGADPARIAVAGDSAGGHLAAVTALQSAWAGGPSPAFQLLIYPVTDCTGACRSRQTFAEGFILTKEGMEWYESQFLAPSDDQRDPRISPLLAESVAGTAPAMVVTAGFDPLRDEGEAYAQRLQDAGVHTIVRRHPGYIHGFINALGLGAGPRAAVAEMGGALRVALQG